MRRLLLLGGTAEARRLARAFADGFGEGASRIEATLSLAGVTSSPPDPGIPVRTGGFGGAEALAGYLADNGVEVLVDATHPFASRISANAEQACRSAGVARLAMWRPEWRPEPGDDWREFAGWPELVRALPDGARAFLAAGQDGIKAFADDPRLAVGRISCLARALARPAGLPDAMGFIEAMPASERSEEAGLFRKEGITHLVAKNAGGDASRAKLLAARELGLPVLLLARPDPPAGPLHGTVDSLLAALSPS